MPAERHQSERVEAHEGVDTMRSNVEDLEAKGGETHIAGPALDRRDLMKLGAGAVLAALAGPGANAQEEARTRADEGGERRTNPVLPGARTGAGYKNNAGRISGNGPMDRTSQQLVSFVTSFSESKLTEPALAGLGTYLVDSMAALIAGFETDSGRIGARLGRMTRCEMKSSILGYGVETSPNLAALANAIMIRHKDYNDMGPGSHSSVIVPGLLAVGEALHSTGPQVLAAVALGVELLNAFGQAEPKLEAQGVHWDTKYDGIATALAVGKLLGLNEDKLANALSLALVPHIPLFVSHVGALSHFKNMHAAISIHDGVFAALLAREGMTGPAQPFEERGGLFDSVTGPYKELRLPVSREGRLTVENMSLKRFPTDGDHQALLTDGIPAVRAWAKVDEIESINFEIPFGHWQENADPPKWDPHNSETADHSLPYVMAVALMNGEIYLSDYTPERYLKDASIRQVMQKITCTGNSEFGFHRSRITVRKKSGEQLVKDVFEYRPMSNDEVVRKLQRVCAYMSVSDEQRDRALANWSHLERVRDIADPIRDLAHFGKPLPL
jgi:2-methylcitrate dehydratase